MSKDYQDYENPMAPLGAPIQECCIQFYSPLDPRMNQFRIDENFISLAHLLDEALLETPTVSEGEIESGEEETLENKQGRIQQNTIKYEDAETIALHALVAEVKSNHNLQVKVEEDEKSGETAWRSTSQSSSSSTEMSSKSHKSISPNSPKRSASPVRFQLVEYQSSSSSSPSPASSCNKSSTYTSSSKQRASPKRRQYSRSSIRSPSRSPIHVRSSSRYKSSKYTSSKRHSSGRSPSGKQCSSRSYIRTSSHSPSPARSSRRYKSYEKSSRHRSSSPEQSLTPCRSASRYDSSSHFGRSYNRLKSPSLDKRSKRHRSRSKRSAVQQKNIPIEDEFTKLLAKEKKRQMNDSCNLEEELQVVVEKKVASSEEKEIPEEMEPTYDTKDLSQDEQNSVEKESEIVNEDRLQTGPTFLQLKNFKEDIKSEFIDKKGCLLNSFYCISCQLSLNSESTWQSHINGKKHAKVLKLQTVHEVAKGSIAIPSNPALAIEEIPRFANPAPGTRHFRITDEPRLQPAIDNITKYPILGLQSVREIRAEMEVHYYCELCDAPCSAHSIMPHLTGYKHQLRFLKEIDPACYERNKLLPKKQYEHRLSEILFEHEHKFGRGQIKIFEEREDPRSMVTYGVYSQPGSSMGNFPLIKKERGAQGAAAIPPNDEFLDISKADFYCKLCDAHMNNVNMWEAHVRGKRHLTNAKKIPGENISKVRSVKAPAGTRSILEKLVREKAAGEIVVGLGFIKETQGPNGEIYNCFLCGSCCTNFDIVDHLLLTKHRIRYLETLAADGKPNAIYTISQIEMQDDYFRKHLIDDECDRMCQLYGSGKVDVYISKR